MSSAIIIGFFTIVAIILGPILAVIVSRINDNRRAEKERQFDVFRTLIKTREMPIHEDHVGALNLVEIEFIKHKKVTNAWRNYLVKLGEKLPPVEDKDGHVKVLQERGLLLTKLIQEISHVLKVKFEPLDILEGNYIPQKWHDDELEQRLTRRAIINLTLGKAPILVQTLKPHHLEAPYPPPPFQDDT